MAGPHQFCSFHGAENRSRSTSPPILLNGNRSAHDVTVKDWLIHHGDWRANCQAVFLPSRSPGGVPIILKVDQTGKAKVVLEGKRNVDLGWMIHSPGYAPPVVGKYILTDNNARIVN